jgi:hypothetical protein
LVGDRQPPLNNVILRFSGADHPTPTTTWHP